MNAASTSSGRSSTGMWQQLPVTARNTGTLLFLKKSNYAIQLGQSPSIPIFLRQMKSVQNVVEALLQYSKLIMHFYKKKFSAFEWSSQIFFTTSALWNQGCLNIHLSFRAILWAQTKMGFKAVTWKSPLCRSCSAAVSVAQDDIQTPTCTYFKKSFHSNDKTQRILKIVNLFQFFSLVQCPKPLWYKYTCTEPNRRGEIGPYHKVYELIKNPSE